MVSRPEKRFKGFERGVQFERVPMPLVSSLLEEFDDLNELKLTLRLVWMLNQRPLEWRAIAAAEISADRTVAAMLDATGSELERKVQSGLDSLSKRGVLVSCKTETGTEYLLNTAENRNTVLRMGRRSKATPSPEAVPSHDPPNYGGVAWRAYEKNIGVLTPKRAEDLSDALTKHSESDVADAIKQAVKSNARNWNYVAAVLKRREEHGKGGKDGRPARVSEEDTEEFVRQYLARQRARGNY